MPDPRRRSEGIATRYVEERQRRRWPRAAITRRAQGGCELIQRQNSSPMLRHRNRHPSLSEPRKTPARDPLYFFNSLLAQAIPSCSASPIRLSLPVGPFGISSTTSTVRGTLKLASRSAANSRRSLGVA